MSFVMTNTNRSTANINNSSGGSWALNRLTAVKDAGGGKNYHPASSYTEQLRRNAIGKSTYGSAKTTNYADGANKNTIAHRLQKARSGGAVAPAKKGASPFKSGGTSRITGSGGNRNIPKA